MKADKPIFLDLFKIKFPPMAIASILHRLSGVVLFLAIPFLLYFLHKTYLSQDSFVAAQQLLQTPLIKLLMWIVLAAVFYHLLAGIRHLIMDLGIGESLKAGRLTAIIVILLEVVVIIWTGVWLW